MIEVRAVSVMGASALLSYMEVGMEKIKTLSVDLETYSSVDLDRCGVYKYAESSDFEILLFGYSINGGEVQVVDLACGEELPAEVFAALLDDSVIKWAHNSAFERVCLSRYMNDYDDEIEARYGFRSNRERYLSPKSWRCSMVWSAYMGLPLSLKGVGTVLGLEKQKLEEGKDLIRYFTVPCKPTKSNGGRTRNLPVHDPVKWEKFKEYNKRESHFISCGRKCSCRVIDGFDNQLEYRNLP